MKNQENTIDTIVIQFKIHYFSHHNQGSGFVTVSCPYSTTRKVTKILVARKAHL